MARWIDRDVKATLIRAGRAVELDVHLRLTSEGDAELNRECKVTSVTWNQVAEAGREHGSESAGIGNRSGAAYRIIDGVDERLIAEFELLAGRNRGYGCSGVIGVEDPRAKMKTAVEEKPVKIDSA